MIGQKKSAEVPVLRTLFTGDKNQQVHAEIVSSKLVADLSEKDIKKLPEDVQEAFAKYGNDYILVEVKLANSQGNAQDYIVASSGQMPREGDQWIFTTPEPDSVQPHGVRTA